MNVFELRPNIRCGLGVVVLVVASGVVELVVGCGVVDDEMIVVASGVVELVVGCGAHGPPAGP